MFSVEIEGESEIRAMWGQAYGALKRGAMSAVSKGVKEGAEEARTKHTFQNRTHTLEKSIEGFVTGWANDETFRGTIVARAKYASFVDAGTRPHLIVGNPFLAFEWKGERVFFRYVNHPGTKPLPFMHLAYFKAERVIIRELELAEVRAQEILQR